jgi:hypothetical protein
VATPVQMRRSVRQRVVMCVKVRAAEEAEGRARRVGMVIAERV